MKWIARIVGLEPKSKSQTGPGTATTAERSKSVRSRASTRTHSIRKSEELGGEKDETPPTSRHPMFRSWPC